MKYNELPHCCLLLDKDGFGAWYVWKDREGKVWHHNISMHGADHYAGATVEISGSNEVAQYVVELMPIIKKVQKKDV